ncbi:MAG: hypothetical protein ACRDKY_12010 [Solirubrobacteraceae bacterium]
MNSNPPLTLAANAHEAQRALMLAAIGAWTAIVPYLARALGLEVNVPALVEVVDHVVPGAVVVAAGLYLHRAARRRTLARERFALPAAGVAFLAGFWGLATHVPLLQDASRSDVTWEAALFHFAAALPIVLLAGWFLLRSIPDS